MMKSDEHLLQMIRLVGESSGLDDLGATAVRRSSCLSMSRLDALTGAALQPDVEERAHLRHCRLCALRYQAMRSHPAAPVHSSMHRWLTNLTGIAAAALLALALWPALRIGVAPDSIPSAVIHRGAQPNTTTSATMASALSCVPCDANCDGWFDPFDVDAFILAVTDKGRFKRDFPTCDSTCGIDLDGDGEVDRNDVEPFVACMISK